MPDAEQFAELLGIVDRAAGREHSRDGDVAWALREVLTRHALMLAEDPRCRACVENEHLFAMQWRRIQEATELWRAEDPEARALVQPDLGRLLAWLLVRVKRAGVGPGEPMAAARNLLDREVIVTLSRDPLIERQGRLVCADEGGEVVLIDADGFARWCWPMLDIREAPDGPTPTP